MDNRKRKIGEMRDQETVGHNFAKYSVLVSELRQHVLTYLDSATLWNYSQCSKVCDSEIQKYNTKRPSVVFISENSHGILVKLSYSKVIATLHYFDGKPPRFVDHFFKFSDYENAMEPVEKLLMKVYRYVKIGRTEEFEFNLKKWPTKVMSIIGSSELYILKIYMHYLMLDDFIEFAETGKTRVNKLSLGNFNFLNHAEIKKEQAKHLFSLKWFQNLSEVIFYMNCEIDDDDFLGFKNTTKFFALKKRAISDDAIRQKVSQMSTWAERHIIRMEVRGDRTPKFDLQVLFPQAEQRPSQYGQFCQVGNVDLRIEDYRETIHMCNNA